MPDFSDTSAHHPTSAPDAPTFDTTKDGAADRDDASPTEFAGSHAQRIFKEVVALSLDLRSALGLYVTDAGGLDVAYTAGRIRAGSGAPVDVSASTVTLTDNDTSYVECDAAGAVSANITAFTAGSFPMATVVTSGGDISSVTDDRAAWLVSDDSTVDHGALGGLGDVADHPDYLLMDGTRDVATIVYEAATELTIAAGVVTRTRGLHLIDTQDDDASDNLDTISGGSDGMSLRIRAAHTDRTVVLKDGTGNLSLNGNDIALSDLSQWIELLYDGPQSKWVLVAGTGAANGDMLKATYDSDDDGLVDAAAGGLELDTSGSTGVPSVSAGTWSIAAALSLALGGTGQNFSAAAKGSVIVFNAVGVASIITSGTTGHVPTIQADDTVAFAAPAGVGDMLQSTYDTDTDGIIDNAAGGTGVDSSAATGFHYVEAGAGEVVLCLRSSASAPTVNDDDIAGFAVFSLMVHSGTIYMCRDNTTGEAVWDAINAAVSAHALDSATHTDVNFTSPAGGDIIYFDGAEYVNRALGPAGTFLGSDGSTLRWQSGAGSVAHTLDGSIHTDVAAIVEAHGQTLYRNGSSQWDALAPGTDGQVLGTQGAGADPHWVWAVLADGTVAMTQVTVAASSELTIAAGSVTKTQSYHRIDTAADDVTDDLDTIAGGSDGELLWVRAEHTDRTVVLKHGTGNLELAGADITLDATDQAVPLLYDGTLAKWVLASAGGGGGGGSDTPWTENHGADGYDLADLGDLNFDAPTELTLSGGAVTMTQSAHSIDTEGDAATDEVDTINGGTEGDALLLYPANAARRPWLTQDDNIITPGGRRTPLPDGGGGLLYDGSNWRVFGIAHPYFTEDYTLNLTSGMSVATMQGLIDDLPENLNGREITIQFGDGTYTMTAAFNVRYFYGGIINLWGNMGDTLKSTTKSVHLNATGYTDALTFSYNRAYCEMQNLKVTADTTSAHNYAIYASANDFLHFVGNYVLGTSASYGYGLDVLYTGTCDILSSYFSNIRMAIQIEYATTAYATDNDDTGTMPEYGAYITRGGVLGLKIPVVDGSVADYTSANGGQHVI